MLAPMPCASPPASRTAATVLSSEPAKGCWPSWTVRATQITRPPSDAKSRAMSAPMPRLAPVTTTIFPSSRPMGTSGPLLSTTVRPGQPGGARRPGDGRALGRRGERGDAEPLAREDPIRTIEPVPLHEQLDRDSVLPGDAPDGIARLDHVDARARGGGDPRGGRVQVRRGLYQRGGAHRHLEPVRRVGRRLLLAELRVQRFEVLERDAGERGEPDEAAAAGYRHPLVLQRLLRHHREAVALGGTADEGGRVDGGHEVLGLVEEQRTAVQRPEISRAGAVDRLLDLGVARVVGRLGQVPRAELRVEVAQVVGRGYGGLLGIEALVEPAVHPQAVETSGGRHELPET